MMQRTVVCKLTPSPEQREALEETLERFALACNYVVTVAWREHTASKFKLQRFCYRNIRETFGLSANLAVRAIARVAGACRRDRARQHTFRPTSVDYDARIFRLVGQEAVSLTTTRGRLHVPLALGEYQRRMLTGSPTSAVLSRRRGVFFVHVVVEQATPEEQPPGDFLGIDLGIVNLTVDSDGTTYCGEPIEQQRRRYAHRRRNLQHKGTRAARRKLRRISGRQQRFQRNTNHIISKCIVAKAQRTGRGIALENLKGIRDRVKASRRQRARLHNWPFRQLQTFIAYKAMAAGIPIILVDPRHTSQTCPACGHVAKANRPSQTSFSCTSCGYAALADMVAARNIRARAVVMQPMVPASHRQAQAPGL